MFLANFNNSALGPLWRAAYGFKAENDNLAKLCHHLDTWITDPPDRPVQSLGVSSIMLNGACRLYKSALEELLADCNELLMDMVTPKTGKMKVQTIEEQSSNGSGNEISYQFPIEHDNRIDQREISNMTSKLDSCNDTESEGTVQQSEENSRSQKNSDSSSSSRKRQASSKSAENVKRSRTNVTEVTQESEESDRGSQNQNDGSSTAVSEEQSRLKSCSTQSNEAQSDISKQESPNQKDIFSKSISENQESEDGCSSQRTEEFRAGDISSHSSDSNVTVVIEQQDTSKTAQISETNQEKIRCDSSPDDDDVEEAVHELDGSKSCESNDRVTDILSMLGDQTEAPPQKTTRDVEIQAGSFLSKQRRLPMEESFDENLPFGFIMVYDNLNNRFPSKVIFTLMNADVTNL